MLQDEIIRLRFLLVPKTSVLLSLRLSKWGRYSRLPDSLWTVVRVAEPWLWRHQAAQCLRSRNLYSFLTQAVLISTVQWLGLLEIAHILCNLQRLHPNVCQGCFIFARC